MMQHMEIAWTSSTLGFVQSRSRSRRDFEIFLHSPQYKHNTNSQVLYISFGTCKEVVIILEHGWYISAFEHVRMLILSSYDLVASENANYKYSQAWVS